MRASLSANQQLAGWDGFITMSEFAKNSLYESGILAGRTFPKVKAYYFKEWDGFNMPLHMHNSVEIMYVISGKCLVETKDDSYILKKGEFILLDANIEHRLQVDKDKPCRMLNIEFGFHDDTDCILSIYELAKDSEEFGRLLQSCRPYMIFKDSEDTYTALKSLILELDRNGGSENLLVQLLFGQLLIKVSRLYCEIEDNSAHAGLTYVKKAVQYIHQHYDMDIAVKDIASAISINPGYLHRIFRLHRDCTVNDYLLRFRVEKAKSLLINTDIQITDISNYVGMNSSQYFAYVFKKITGLTPSAYRKSSSLQVSKY